MRKQHAEKLVKQDRLSQDLVGRRFLHPLNDTLYEITYVYWDSRTDKIAGYRRACGEDIDTNDRYPYAIEGSRGMAKYVTAFEECAGIADTDVKWPQNEAEMLAAQLEDPAARQFIDRIRAGEGEIFIYGQRKRVYMPSRLDAEGNEVRGALRVEEVSMTPRLPESKVWLPASLSKHCLRFFHEGMGHTGASRMKESIDRKYYWPAFRKESELHCANCRQCRLNKCNTRVERIPIQRYPKSVRPFSRAHMDLIELPRSDNGYKYVLVVKCALTHWVELIPLKSKGQFVVADAMFKYIYL